MKYIFIILLAGLFSYGCSKKQAPSANSAIASTHNPQKILNSINSVIEQAVGAEIPDQIPGYTYGYDDVLLESGGIECPKEISDVKQASELLCSKLSSAFTNRIFNIRTHRFAPNGDMVISAMMNDESQEVTISISVFKRSSSRVVLFPVILSEPIKQ